MNLLAEPGEARYTVDDIPVSCGQSYIATRTKDRVESASSDVALVLPSGSVRASCHGLVRSGRGDKGYSWTLAVAQRKTMVLKVERFVHGCETRGIEQGF